MNEFEELVGWDQGGWADVGIVSAHVEKFIPVTDHIARDFVARSSAKGEVLLDPCCRQGALP